MSIGEAFGKVLQEARKKADMGQEQLALLSGVDRAYVSRLERGVTQPTLRTVFRLSRVLDVSPSELIGAVERKRPKFDDKKRSAGRFET